MAREGLGRARRVVPALQAVCFLDLRVGDDGAGEGEGERPAVEVGDFDAFEGDDGAFGRVEVRRRGVPDGEADGIAGLVDEGELALVEGFAGGLGGDLGCLAYFFEHADRVDGGVFFDVLELGEVGEIVFHFGGRVLVFGLLDDGVAFEGEFVVVGEVAEFLVGDLDLAGGGDVVDAAFVDDVVKCVALVVEGCGADLAGFIKEIA